jgi:hypothetical protein
MPHPFDPDSDSDAETVFLPTIAITGSAPGISGRES